MFAALLALAFTTASAADADTTSKKDRYLRDKQAATPTATECCASGVYLPERTCRSEPSCRRPARAGDQAQQVVLVRNLWTEERMPWTGPIVLDRAALGRFLRCHNSGLPGEHPRELVLRVLATAEKFGAHKLAIVLSLIHI